MTWGRKSLSFSVFSLPFFLQTPDTKGMEIFFRSLILAAFFSACAAGNATHKDSNPLPSLDRQPNATLPLIMGLDQWPQLLPYLKGKRVGVICNHSSTNREGTHILELFLNSGLRPNTIFALEHGIRGDAADGESIKNGKDEKTGAAIISLYGAKKSPSPQDLASLDVLLFDIQDVGVRTYTYLSSLKLLLEASARVGKEFILLDRPNPLGRTVAGPSLKPGNESFVGALPIPLVYGLTLGEMAHYLWQENYFKEPHPSFRLRVVPLENYNPQSSYAPPKPPSPNLPNLQAIRLYPSLVFFEGTQFSIGRGTDFPFQVVGAPNPNFGDFRFTPQKRAGVSDQAPHLGKQCFGKDLRSADPKFSLRLLWEMHQKDPKNFLRFPAFFDSLYGEKNAVRFLKEPLTEVEKEWTSAALSFSSKAKAAQIYSSPKSLPHESIFKTARRLKISPGAAVLARCGEFSREGGYGFHHYEKSPGVSLDSIYDIASLTKLFTATAILQLQERGKLSVKQSVGDFLPSFRSPEKASITLEHLLLHSSGLPAANSEKDYDPKNPQNSWQKIIELPLRKVNGRWAQPGETYVYSDIGYLLLGKIIEIATKESLDQYMRQNIFSPLGMASTGFRPTPSSRLVPTGVTPGQPHDERSRWLGGVTGHAGIFSTANDLALFLQELLAPRDGLLLRASSKKGLWIPRGPGLQRAYGWDVDSHHSRNLKQGIFWTSTSRSHTGFTGTSLTVDPASGNFFILLTNRVLSTPTQKTRDIQWLRRWVAQGVCH